MSKNIRQKIARALQTTFRSSSQDRQSSLKSKLSTCCSVTKPKDYEYIPYQPKQPLSSSSSSRHDYVDLSECHSWPSSDSGVSFHSNSSSNISSISSSNHNCHQLQSTRTVADDSCSLSTFSDLSYIPHDQMNISNFDVTAWHPVPSSFECCHCQCHHHVNTDVSYNPRTNFLYVPEQYRGKRSKTEVYPLIF